MTTNRKTVISALATIVTLACALLASTTASAAQRRGWGVSPSHGMRFCQLAVFDGQGRHLSAVQSGGGGVSVEAEENSRVTVTLQCKVVNAYDSDGRLSSVTEGTYNGPDGGSKIGTESPDDPVPTGYSQALGRSWTISVPAVGSAPTFSFGWSGAAGSDTIKVTLFPTPAPVTGPALGAAIAPVKTRADEAYALAETGSGGYENRVFAFTGGYILDLDSLSESGSARQGWGLDANVFLGGRGPVKFLTGLTFDQKFRQKPLVAAPNLPANGFNSRVDWQTYYVGPKAGVDFMPSSWVQLQAWWSFGVLVSVDGTVPLSQLPDRTLYSGESQTQTALGYNGRIALNFILGEHLVIGSSIGLTGNITKVAKERGPEMICNQQTGDCLVQRKGHFLDAPFMVSLGGQF